MTTITCDHCESEIDAALDPRCVVYDPSGATDVICTECRAHTWEATKLGAQHEAYRIKRGWRA